MILLYYSVSNLNDFIIISLLLHIDFIVQAVGSRVILLHFIIGTFSGSGEYNFLLLLVRGIEFWYCYILSSLLSTNRTNKEKTRN